METVDAVGVVLERKVRNTAVRITAREDETLDQVYNRFLVICQEIENAEAAKERAEWVEEMHSEVKEAISNVKHLFKLTEAERTEAGLTNDYHMVILSLLHHFDNCMGATDIANDWTINSGRVSRVFTASRKTYRVYKGHFVKCKKRKYRFTTEGLEHALEHGLSAILGEEGDDN